MSMRFNARVPPAGWAEVVDVREVLGLSPPRVRRGRKGGTRWRQTSPPSLEMAMSWVCNVNSTCLTRRNELDGGGSRHGAAFVPNDVCVIMMGIGKRHVSGIDVGVAVGIVLLILGHRARCDDNQAMPRVCVPAGASSRVPHIALYVQV
jgi:hypothetical protein